MLSKNGYVSDFEGRSINSHILVLVRESIAAFEKEHGTIDGKVNPDQNVKPVKR